MIAVRPRAKNISVRPMRVVTSPRDDEIGEDRVERGTGKRRCKHPDVGIAGLGSNDEPDDGADDMTPSSPRFTIPDRSPITSPTVA